MNDTVLLKPNCFEECLLLHEQWNTGNHARAVGLNLMFHCWYLTVEPALLTGFDQARADELGLDFIKTFNEVHDSFALEIRNDPEMLYAVGLMAQQFPWALGDETEWMARSLEYLNLYKLLEPSGLDPKSFEGRGEYGRYFAHRLRVAQNHRARDGNSR